MCWHTVSEIARRLVDTAQSDYGVSMRGRDTVALRQLVEQLNEEAARNAARRLQRRHAMSAPVRLPRPGLPPR